MLSCRGIHFDRCFTQFINFLLSRNETWIAIMRLLTFELITRSPLLRMKRQIESILIDQLHNFSLHFNLFSSARTRMRATMRVIRETLHDELRKKNWNWISERTCSSELNDGRRRHFGSLFGSITHEEQDERRESRENSKKSSEEKF